MNNHLWVLEIVLWTALAVNIGGTIFNEYLRRKYMRLIDRNFQLEVENLQRQAFLERTRIFQGNFYEAFDRIQKNKRHD